MKHVLVVEDQPFILMDLEDQLRDAGFQVTGASSVNQAIAAFDEKFGSVDIALVDFRLGAAITAVPVVQHYREKDPNFRILGYTGNPEEWAAAFQDTDFACDIPVLSKPAEPHVIVGKLSALLEQMPEKTGLRHIPLRGRHFG